jgi:predicted ATPase
LISELALENFKGIGKEVCIELKPLTIFVGPNGSGKSSVLEAISLISQSINSGYPPLNLQGELVKFSHYRTLFYREDVTLPLRFVLKIILSEEEHKQIKSSLVKVGFYTHENEHRTSLEITYEYILVYPNKIKNPQYSIEQSYTVRQAIRINGKIFARTSREFVNQDFVQKLEIPWLDNQPVTNKGVNDRILNVLPFSTQKSGFDEYNTLIESIIRAFRIRLENKVRILYSTRGTLPYSITTDAAIAPDWVGPKGDHLLQIISSIFLDHKKQEVKNKVLRWAPKFGMQNLNASLDSKENRLSSYFLDDITNTILNTASSGFGSRQVLAILVQIFWSAKEDIILIEEPEISLDPEAQIHLPELFAAALRDQKSIIATTHSHFFILALNIPIKKKLIRADEIAIYNFQKTSEGTKVTRLELDENGYLKGWIPSFTKTESELMNAFLETVPEI